MTKDVVSWNHRKAEGNPPAFLVAWERAPQRWQGWEPVAEKASMELNVKFDYHSKRWRRIQATVLRRDGYLCQDCKRYGRMSQANTVHHIKRVEERPDLAFDPANLISLCASCHNKRHPEKAAAHNLFRY